MTKEEIENLALKLKSHELAGIINRRYDMKVIISFIEPDICSDILLGLSDKIKDIES